MKKIDGVIVIRCLIAALFAALAVTSFAAGRTIGGVLFAALAIANVALLVTVQRRRAALRRRFPRWGGDGPRRWRDVA